MSSACGRIKKWVGSVVYIEGIFPIPNGQGGVVYSAAMGTLLDVYDDGVEVLEKGNDDGTIFLFTNLRSITKYKAPSELSLPKRSGLIG